MTERRYWFLMALLSAGVGAGVTVAVRLAQPAASPGPSAPARPASTLIPDVARVLAALKLVTVEVHAAVDASSGDPSWRGDASAVVRAPVTFFYGVDLSDLGPGRVGVSPLTGGVRLRLPAPRRLATEIAGDWALESVRVTGLRLRELSGEYHLGLARAGLYESARRMALSDAQRGEVERLSRDQVATLVRAVLGEGTPVEVVFDAAAERAPDAPASAGAAAGTGP